MRLLQSLWLAEMLCSSRRCRTRQNLGRLARNDFLNRRKQGASRHSASAPACGLTRRPWQTGCAKFRRLRQPHSEFGDRDPFRRQETKVLQDYAFCTKLRAGMGELCLEENFTFSCGRACRPRVQRHSEYCARIENSRAWE